MKRELERLVEEAVKKLFGVEMTVELTRPDEQFGDYATNVALQLAGKLHKNPHEIAEQLAETVREQSSEIKDIDVAGAGFLNIHLSDSALLGELTRQPEKSLSGTTVVIETNNPNPFKDLHIGHALNSILADTIANLLVAGGADTHRVSYHGDVGLHVGKSMWAILRFVDGDAERLQQIPEAERPRFLSEKYAQGAAAYEQDEAAKQEIDQLAKESFTQTDELFKKVYDTCKAWSFEYFAHIFTSMGSQPVEKKYLESQTDEAGREVVEEHIGDVFEQSNGAVIFPGEKYGLHTRVFISSRGTTLYEARDLGLMRLKQADFNPAKSFIVTAVEQKEYFNVVFKAAELALPELAGVTRNISNGTVKLTTGKMSSRQGTAINIGWLFDEVEKALKARGAGEASLQAGVVGALRYTMLKNRLGSDIIFDVNEAISLEGNSGPYLQYAHARARSILTKSKATSYQLPTTSFEPDERNLARKISEYPEVVELATTELMPHYICTYLYELAQKFNSFYEHNRVIGSGEREAFRLYIVKSYADTLKKGLNLLGITAPDKM